MEAATLHCPECGAPASPDAAACGYCHARLAVVSCSRCFAHAFEGMRHCPACGHALDRRPEPDESTEMACPRCAGVLQPVRLGARRLRECATCAGLWIDNRTVLAIFHDHDRDARIVSDHAHAPGAGTAAGTGHPLRVGYVRCPACQALMSRVNFARVSGVVVDVCREHGTWFEPGELRRVVELIDRGGIPRGVTRAAMDAYELFLAGDTAAGGRDPWSAIFDHFTPREGP